MNKFKRSLVTLTLLSSTMAFAGPGQVGSATEPNQQADICTSYRMGMVGETDVLLAEKSQLEIRLVKNSGDYQAYKALTENALQRLQNVKSRYQYGLVSVDDVALAQSEIIGMKASCSVLLASAQKLYNVGMKTKEQVQTIQSACELLAAQ
ncbi:MAG: hypothetical protein J7501_14535 [Bdellovibrio sp.]|nr:hypothetical protein [Bdellovibrio sp.]